MIALWDQALPSEVQREIALCVIDLYEDDDSDISLKVSLRLVNAEWCHVVSPLVFRRIFLNSQERYKEISNPAVCLDHHQHPVRWAHTFVISAYPFYRDAVNHGISKHLKGHFPRHVAFNGNRLVLQTTMEDPDAPDVLPGVPVGILNALVFIQRYLQPERLSVWSSRHTPHVEKTTMVRQL